jgi:hypothetical protein
MTHLALAIVALLALAAWLPFQLLALEERREQVRGLHQQMYVLRASLEVLQAQHDRAVRPPRVGTRSPLTQDYAYQDKDQLPSTGGMTVRMGRYTKGGTPD